MKRQHKGYSVETIQYTDDQSKLFEQSLDVYRPTTITSTNHERDNVGNGATILPTRPTITILVVGSGWMGHLPIIYWPTSWWNSSGPKTIAKLGHTCVCVRHRGAFPHFLGWEMLLIGCGCCALLGLSSLMHSLIVICIVVGMLAIAPASSATLDDMTDDVFAALRWIKDNTDDILEIDAINEASTTNQHANTASTTDSIDPIIVFGGYSSGGHVAATTLSKPKEVWTNKGLPQPTEWFDHILLVSGVLAVSSTPNESQRKQIESASNKATPSDDSIALDTSFEWFQRWVVEKAFGDEKNGIQPPSPLFETNSIPKIPHTLIGCERELMLDCFTPILGIFLCSEQYLKRLQSLGIPCTYESLKTANHWTILNSHEFSDTLETCYDKFEATTFDNNSSKKIK